jgi:TPR repeat protein
MRGRAKRIWAILLLLGLLQPAAALAATYEEGDAAFHRKDYDTAMRHWLVLAHAGHVGAQVGVARLYYGGLGVALDYDLAFQWGSKAAEQNDPNAQYIVGAMYRDGKGVGRDGAAAMAFFLKAAGQRVPGAQYNIGLMYLTGELVTADPAEAYYWLGLAATAQGKEHAQMRTTAAYARDQARTKLSAQQIAEQDLRINAAQAAQAR